MASQTAAIDENSKQSLTAVSSVDGVSILKLYADPTTHRLLVTLGGVVTSGYQVPTGTVNGSNQTFIFTSAPNAIVVDGITLNKVQSDGTVSWTGTTTVILSVAPNNNIFSVA